MDAATVAGSRPALPFARNHARILIVCAVRLLGDGLAEVLEAEEAVAAVSQSASLDDALAHVDSGPPPDVVLIDAALARGPAALRRFHQVDPRVRCIAFGIEDRFEGSLRWVDAGAAALVGRSASLAELIGVLRLIISGGCIGSGAFLPPASACAGAVGAMRSGGHGSGRPGAALTRRERQILEQIYAGRSNKEIARVLGIEPSTVKCHVHNLLAKLNLQRRAQAAVWLREHRAGSELR